MNPKLLGASQLIGAIIAIILGFLDQNFFAIIFLALVFIVMSVHHLTEASAHAAAPAPVARRSTTAEASRPAPDTFEPARWPAAAQLRLPAAQR